MKTSATAPCLFLATGLAACGAGPLRASPPWPGAQAEQGFDLRPIESRRAIRITEQVAFALGVSESCPNLALPADPPGDDLHLGQLGRATYSIVLAEAERLHPGVPDNRWAADQILANMMAQGAALGRDAANARGCGAMKPEYDAAWQALRGWRPVEPSGEAPPPADQ